MDGGLQFDLRKFVLDKLKNSVGDSEFIRYKQARCVLGRVLHMKRRDSRIILISMSKSGMIKIKRDKIYLNGSKSITQTDSMSNASLNDDMDKGVDRHA